MMIIYRVEYWTNYDDHGIIDHYMLKEDAENKRDEVNKNNSGIGCYVVEIYVN